MIKFNQLQMVISINQNKYKLNLLTKFKKWKMLASPKKTVFCEGKYSSKHQ